MTLIALATSAEGRPEDDDLAPLVLALEALGATVAVIDWDDTDADWASFDRVVIRSTWDYTTRHAEFLDWCRRCGAITDLINAPRVIEWSTDKVYLESLVAAGVRCVASSFVRPGDDLGAIAESVLPDDIAFVVKPTVSAGSRDTVLYTTSDEDRGRALAQITELVSAGRTVMIQPYQHDVDIHGEIDMLYFNGVFSHAIGKAALLSPGADAHRALFAQETVSVAHPTDEHFRVADSLMAALGSIDALSGVRLPLPYARIDLVIDNDGQVALLELECVEPSVFLAWSDGSAERFARVILDIHGG